MNRLILAALLLTFTTGTAANAAVLYSESGDGDLTGIPADAGALVLGSNEVTGSMATTPPVDVDNFYVTLGAGLEIVSISLSYRALANGEQITAGLYTPSNNLFDDNFGSTIGSGTGISASFVDTFGPETGTLSGSQWNFDLNGGTLYSALNWTATIVTQAIDVGGNDDTGGGDKVPAPAAFPLIFLGLAGVRLLSRRRRA